MNVSASNVLGTCCTIVWYLSQTSRRDYEKLEASLSLVRCDYFQFLEFVIARPPPLSMWNSKQYIWQVRRLLGKFKRDLTDF